MKTFLLLMVLSWQAFAANDTQCVKPKFMREAITEIYLSKLHPETDRLLAKSRTNAETWKAIDRVFWDVYRCFGKIGGCPPEKRKWDRSEHDSAGVMLLNEQWQSDKLRGVDMQYMRDKLRFLIEESECSDF